MSGCQFGHNSTGTCSNPRRQQRQPYLCAILQAAPCWPRRTRCEVCLKVYAALFGGTHVQRSRQSSCRTQDLRYTAQQGCPRRPRPDIPTLRQSFCSAYHRGRGSSMFSPKTEGCNTQDPQRRVVPHGSYPSWTAPSQVARWSWHADQWLWSRALPY